MNDKDYKFINEKILHKKSPLIKKFLLGILITVITGIVFGIVARFTFEVSGRIFGGIFTSKENISEEQEKKDKPEADGKKVKSAKRHRKKKRVKIRTLKVIEKRVPASLSDYKSALLEFGSLAEKENKSVVEVQSVTIGKDWFENPYEIINTMAGYVVKVTENNAYILTNYKDIKKAEAIKLHFKNGITLDGVIKNHNIELGLALIEADLRGIKDTEKNGLIPLRFENSSISIGEPIMAIGNPNGNMYSVITGKVTGVNSEEIIDDYHLDAFFTDINLSKNGNALFLNFDGNVIGIKSKTSDDVCKIISMSKITHFVENMINDIGQPYLGIKTKKFDGAFEKTGMNGGILVDGVRKGSPASSQIRNGDIIYRMDDTLIRNIATYENVLEEKKPGEKIKMLIYRVTRNKGKKIEVELEIGDKYTK